MFAEVVPRMAIRGQMQTKYAWIPNKSMLSTQWFTNLAVLKYMYNVESKEPTLDITFHFQISVFETSVYTTKLNLWLKLQSIVLYLMDTPWLNVSWLAIKIFQTKDKLIHQQTECDAWFPCRHSTFITVQYSTVQCSTVERAGCHLPHMIGSNSLSGELWPGWHSSTNHFSRKRMLSLDWVSKLSSLMLGSLTCTFACLSGFLSAVLLLAQCPFIVWENLHRLSLSNNKLLSPIPLPDDFLCKVSKVWDPMLFFNFGHS